VEEISLTINGQSVHCAPGTTILDAARSLGIAIPTLCHHPDLKPAGACRICLVEDETSGRILASCVTPAAPSMAILTHSPAVLRHRKNIVRLMMANHPESCIVCDQGNRCSLRAVAADLGVGTIDLYPMKQPFLLEEANPFIVRDLSKCILCGRCIRADRELVVVGAIDYHHRGFEARPATLHEQPLEKSPCTFCGTCVSLCPTGALRTRTPGYAGTPETWFDTVCGFCGAGCSLRMGTSAGRVVDVEPVKRQGTVNGAALCVRGHFEHDYLNAPDRLKHPVLARDGERAQASWEEAASFVVERFRRIRDEHGPQSVAFWGSSRCTLEENYLLQKISRVLVGTNNVVSGPEQTEEEGRLRAWGTRTLDAIEHAEAILVAGANPTDSVPVLGYAIKRAARWRNVPLVVLDPCRTDLVPLASAWLAAAPRWDAAVVDALAAALFERGARVNTALDGWSAYAERLAGLDRQAACRRCGMEPSSLERAAGVLEGKRVTFVIGDGIRTQPHAGAALQALENLALLTDSLEAPSGGFVFPARENDLEGALDMGASSGLLPGRSPIQDLEARKMWERVWGVRLSPDPGLSPNRLIEEMEKGNLKALYVMGENPVRNRPQPECTRAALKNLELLVVQDILKTETSGMAHAILPGAASSEKSGVFTNLEGRIQRFESAVDPPGESRPDWQILADLYDGLGPSPGRYASLEDVQKEIRDHVPGYEAMPVGSGRNGAPRYRGRSGPSPDDSGPAFRTTQSEPEGLVEQEGFPHVALLGSPRVHLGGGTRTSRSKRLRELMDAGDVEVSREDCERLGLQAGDRVRVVSVLGAVERAVRPSPRMRAGYVFVPTGACGNSAMHLVGATPLGAAERACRVRIERIQGVNAR